jgi:hypothetical protein
MTPEELNAEIDKRAADRASNETAQLFSLFRRIGPLQARPSSLRSQGGIVTIGEALIILQADIESALLPGVRSEVRDRALAKLRQILEGL